jgi:CSLREA domain-containing protein
VAGTITVNSTSDAASDDGLCTLREAITSANTNAASGASAGECAAGSGDDTITFSVTGTINLTGALPYVKSNMTLSGPGAKLLAVARADSAATDFHIFTVDTGVVVNISGLTLTGGKDFNGGGLQNLGALTINGCAISGNTGHSGGGIQNEFTGNLTIYNSIISGNSAPDFGGGINNNGALTVINSTISGNRTDLNGGGIKTGSSGSTLTVVGSTITDNHADVDDNSVGAGGGISTFETITVLRDTIVAGNFRRQASPVRDDVDGTLQATSSFNLIGDGTGMSGVSGGTSGNQVGTAVAPIDPLLLPLADNGGPTQTHRPKPDSPAVDMGKNFAKDASNNTIDTDQRGRSRPVLSGVVIAPGGDGSDIGAVEVTYAVLIEAGTPQSANINAAFPTQLKVNVTEATLTASGVTVTFVAPASGASGTFQGTGTNTTSVTTGSNGDATAPVFTANSVVGGYTVQARLSAGVLNIFSLTNTKLDQTINFGTLPGKTFGDANFDVSATASSGLPVSFAASGNCTNSGATIHITGTGSCIVTASQAGDATHNAAPNVQRSFNIAKADTTTTVTVSNATYDGNPHGGTASVTGPAGLNQTLTVTYTGRNSTVYGPSTTAPTNAGDYTASASYAGDSNYNPSSDSENFSIAKASQTITFDAIPDKTFGDADFTINATASSGLPVSFGNIQGSSCTVTGNTVHINSAQRCMITATQLGDSNYNGAPAVSRTFEIAQATTSVAVSSSANPSAFGQSVTFTATVTSPAGFVPNGIFGTVNFAADGVTIPNCASLLSVSGQGSCTTSALSPGRHTITADYGTISQNFTGSNGTLQGGQLVGSLIQFAQSSYNVAEGASLTVTVTRTGDTSQAASVDYATDDGSTPSVVVPCSSVTGLALDRCDYTKALGTLRFAAGETSKTLQVLVGDDSYAEGPETAHVRLSNPSGAGALDTTSSATFTIADDSPESAGNTIDNTDAFVRQHYLDFLNREPDAPGLAFWKNEIDSCGTGIDAAQCREVKRINVSAAFFLSIEFQETGYLVERTYKAAFGDTTSPGVAGTVPVIRLDEFLPDTQRIGQGLVVGQGAWQAQLEANKVAYFQEFVTRSRFANAADVNMPPAHFVDALFSNAGVTPTAAERQAAIDEFAGAANTTNTAARARALRRVAEHPALNQLEKNRAFVLMEYFGYMRRNPNDAPEPTLNYAGWKFWLGKLEQFDGNFVRAEMVKAFITSDEYRHRFGQ